MSQQEKSPSGRSRDGAYKSFLTGDFNNHNNAKTKRQVLDLAEKAYLASKRRLMATPTPENVFSELVLRRAFQHIWRQA